MKISIITVTYNSGKTIKDTLQSISNQDYKNIEHIIVDGDSTDDTLEVVKNFPHVSAVISEKDDGLYHAMNKGIKMATGEIIGILNSDDIYAHSMVLSKVANLFSDHSIKASYGDLQYVKASDLTKVVRSWKSGNFQPADFYFGWMPPHPTFFVRSEVYDQVGLFNTTLQSAADYELMLRILFKNQIKSAYIPEVLVKMRTGGISNASLSTRLLANKQDRLAWKINNLKPYFFTLYFKPLRKIFQFIRK